MQTHCRLAGLCVSLVFGLGGCVVHDTQLPELADSRHPTEVIQGEPDFNWHLSGDRRVAPRQVFSDQGRIWLQWHRHQAVPTVFVQQAGGWRVIDQHAQGQYTVIDGPWQRLRFQGGHLQAMAVYRAAAPAAAPCPSSSAPRGSGFDVRLSDGTIRQTLRRWSKQANWFFDDAHWSLTVDFPVTAPATFDTNYETAVQGLLASTRVAGQSVKPCFYANHVLRVIPTAQSCDPMSDQGDRP